MADLRQLEADFGGSVTIQKDAQCTHFGDGGHKIVKKVNGFRDIND